MPKWHIAMTGANVPSSPVEMGGYKGQAAAPRSLGARANALFESLDCADKVQALLDEIPVS
ncbi:hypothetical protein PSm6_30780 [Pseudomonas solani]|uniref:Uncharacterized protein n=1 Tax=Pseudomonas solani TaxID=2731552 RepID=A0ABM7LAU8_9PSED|nr:hypothetical protein PSm6_30780 [Pseudomonas solani]